MHEDKVTFETPERVEVHLELAGVGSRFLAGFVDSLLQGAIILFLGLAVGYLRWGQSNDPSKLPFHLALAVGSAMLVIILYYVGFEMAWGGQSPGKRMAGLVVVRDDGSPIGFSESAIRNILRIVDALPLFYTVGMISIFATRSCKRIGDLAAGTLVVKVRDFMPAALESTPGREPVTLEPVGYPANPLLNRALVHVGALTAQERDTVARFVQRRFELEPESRRVVAARIADSIRHKLPAIAPADVPDPEAFLEIVHQAVNLHTHNRS